MKKTTLIFTLLICFSTTQSHAQLEVIDKVAEVLIPGIASGIKEVIDSSNGSKVKKEEVKEMGVELMQKSQSVVSSISKDLKNITALNDLFKTSGELYDNVGSMKSLTKETFLNKILATNSQELFEETAIQFALQWRQVENKKENLTKIVSDAPSGSVQDDIAQYVSEINDNLNYLTTRLSLTKNPSASMDLDTGREYVSNLIEAAEYIDEIEEALNAINVQLSSRINSFKTSLVEAEQDIENLSQTFQSTEDFD